MAPLQRLVVSVTQCTTTTLTLTPEQQHYLVRVLRLKGGDHFIAIREREWWLAQLHRSSPEAQLLEPIPLQTELGQPLTLLSALPKGSGFDEIVRTTTELGVTTLMPLMTTRSLMNPSPSKLERWRRIATEAAEQSCRQRVPEMIDPMRFEDALALMQTNPWVEHQRLICVTEPDCINLGQALLNLSPLGILIMVGPEGGWTPEEQAKAIAQGFTPVSLGRRVLRAVTAAMAAVAILSTRMEAATEERIDIEQ